MLFSRNPLLWKRTQRGLLTRGRLGCLGSNVQMQWAKRMGFGGLIMLGGSLSIWVLMPMGVNVFEGYCRAVQVTARRPQPSENAVGPVDINYNRKRWDSRKGQWGSAATSSFILLSKKDQKI